MDHTLEHDVANYQRGRERERDREREGDVEIREDTKLNIILVQDV